MRRMRRITAGTCAGLLLWGGATLAADHAAGTQTSPAADDGEFLEQALGVNELELELARLAAERATTPEGKAKAQKMLENHTKLQTQLEDLAKQAGVPGPVEMAPEQQATLAQVASRQGSRFDAVFKQTVDDGHVKELAMYQAEVTRAKNPQLRALAEERVAALKQAVAGAQQSQLRIQ
jgi:putative membrane protein